MSQHEQQWDAMSDEQKIAFLATEVMGWKKAAIAYSKSNTEWWFDGNHVTEYVATTFGSRESLRWKPLSDWNHWRQCEERVMQNADLWSEYTRQIFPGPMDFAEDILKADIAERATGLYVAYQSLR